MKTALQENRIAIVENGEVINVVVAESAAWVQENLCAAGQAAFDVKGLPVSLGWKHDTDFYRLQTTEDGNTKITIDRNEDGTPKIDDETGWAAVKTIPVGD